MLCVKCTFSILDFSDSMQLSLLPAPQKPFQLGPKLSTVTNMFPQWMQPQFQMPPVMPNQMTSQPQFQMPTVMPNQMPSWPIMPTLIPGNPGIPNGPSFPFQSAPMIANGPHVQFVPIPVPVPCLQNVVDWSNLGNRPVLLNAPAQTAVAKTPGPVIEEVQTVRVAPKPPPPPPPQTSPLAVTSKSSPAPPPPPIPVAQLDKLPSRSRSRQPRRIRVESRSPSPRRRRRTSRTRSASRNRTSTLRLVSVKPGRHAVTLRSRAASAPVHRSSHRPGQPFNIWRDTSVPPPISVFDQRSVHPDAVESSSSRRRSRSASATDLDKVECRMNLTAKEIVQLQKCTGSEPEVLRIINYLRDMDPTKMVAYYTFEQLAKFLFVSNFDYQLHMKKCLIRHQQEYYRLFQIPLSNMPGLEGGGCSTYFWAHATTDNGLIGILKLKRVLRTFPDSVGHKTYGFFCGATNNPWSDWEKLRVVIARWTAGKNIANFIISGLAHSNKTQGKCPAGGTEIEQKLCKLHDVCHNAKEKRWCVKPKVTQITDIWIVERIEPDTSPE